MPEKGRQMEDLIDLQVVKPREQVELPKDIRALQLLQMEYRGEIELTHNQRRAAIACLQFESPKLGVISTTTMNADDFASMLDRAIARSGMGMKLIEHRQDEGAKPAPPPIPAHGTERVGPTPDRRFRRG
jgi:hypothetical protein